MSTSSSQNTSNSQLYQSLNDDKYVYYMIVKDLVDKRKFDTLVMFLEDVLYWTQINDQKLKTTLETIYDVVVQAIKQKEDSSHLAYEYIAANIYSQLLSILD